MNQKHDQILRQFFSRFNQDHDRLREELLSSLDASDGKKYHAKPQRRLMTGKNMMRSAFGLAACLCLGLLLWMNLTSSVSFADVQEAIGKQDWVHVKFDNGQERWMSIQSHKFARRYAATKHSYGHFEFIDHEKNMYMIYHADPNSGYIFLSKAVRYESGSDASPEEKQQHLESLPQTPLAFVGIQLRMLTGETTSDKQEPQLFSIKRQVETNDGKNVLRFDFFSTDVLGRKLLMQQVWVDPDTHLPLRIRRRLTINEPRVAGAKYTVGHFDYPTTGPTDIYALGVPRDTQIVDFDQPTPTDIQQISEKAHKARDAFPELYRIIIWPDDMQTSHDSGGIEVLWRDDRSTFQYKWINDLEGVKLCAEEYYSNPKEIENQLSLPVTAQQVLAWTQTKVPDSLTIVDGRHCYIRYKPFLSMVTDSPRATLKVSSASNAQLYNSQIRWPTGYQWRYADSFGSTIKIISDLPDAKKGMIVVRIELGNIRNEYHVDTLRDYICTRQISWTKRSGQWGKSSDKQLLDLVQLPSGQWYARKRVVQTFDDPTINRIGKKTTWNVDIKILTEDQFPTDCFNGKKLLKEAKQNNARIDTK